MLAKGKNYHANIQSNFFMNFLPEKKYGVPSQNVMKKNVLCEKGDEITRFDGTTRLRIRGSLSFLQLPAR
jgi:hypothetical protein